jgi:hypothetical protein
MFARRFWRCENAGEFRVAQENSPLIVRGCSNASRLCDCGYYAAELVRKESDRLSLRDPTQRDSTLDFDDDNWLLDPASAMDQFDVNKQSFFELGNNDLNVNAYEFYAGMKSHPNI